MLAGEAAGATCRDQSPGTRRGIPPAGGSELNRTLRRCSPPNSKAGAALIRLFNQFDFGSVPVFPLLHTLRAPSASDAARSGCAYKRASAADGFWCDLAKGCVRHIASSPGGPRRRGLCRGGTSPPPDLAAAGPRRRPGERSEEWREGRLRRWEEGT